MTDLADRIGAHAMLEQALVMLEGVVPDVVHSKAPARVTLALTLKPSAGGVTVTGKVKLTPPVQARDVVDGWWSQLWLGDDGEVLTANPQQAPLPLPGTITIHTRRDAS